jgi:hypothetical protein
MRRRRPPLIASSTWLLYPETPIKPDLTELEGMVSIIVGPHEELQLDFFDLEPLDRIVRAAKQARRWLRDIEQSRSS